MDAFLTNYNNTGPPGIDPSTAKQLPLATATLNRWRRNNADLESPDTLLSRRPSSFKKANDCVPHRPSVSTATGEKKWPRRSAYFALFSASFELKKSDIGGCLNFLKHYSTYTSIISYLLFIYTLVLPENKLNNVIDYCLNFQMIL